MPESKLTKKDAEKIYMLMEDIVTCEKQLAHDILHGTNADVQKGQAGLELAYADFETYLDDLQEKNEKEEGEEEEEEKGK